MESAGRQVVHQVVAARDRAEDVINPSLLVGEREGRVAEVGLVAAAALIAGLYIRNKVRPAFLLGSMGLLVFADVIPVGGMHITHDIARGLSTTIAHAERMKTLWGSAMATVIDDRETIAVPLLGERGVDTIYHAPKSMLTGIIRPRLEEILEMVRERIDQANFALSRGATSRA